LETGTVETRWRGMEDEEEVDEYHHILPSWV